ncbi:MAG: sugar-binding domain-containing protein [Chthoniobacterales bacterium]
MRTRSYLPRPEYPRPDRQRSFVHGVDWLNLNGSWEFRFDGDRRGVEDEWFLTSEKPWNDQIVVPFCWESLAAWGEADSAGNDHYFSPRPYLNPLEVTMKNHRGAARYEVGWYRRLIVVPENEHWAGKRAILHVGAADFRTDAWCNGHWLGYWEDGYTPFEFDLTDHLTRTPDGKLEALLVLRVEDPMDNREQPVGKQWGWYSSASGIWQTVFVEPRAALHIKRFEVFPDIANKRAVLRIFTNGPGELLIDVTTPTGEILSQKQTVLEMFSETKIELAPVILWDTHAPNLYQLKLTLAGDLPDVVYGYFGMRSLAAAPPSGTAPAALIFNGKPIYLRGALYQSYHCDGVYTAGDLQTLRDDIAQARRFGFDFLRVHIKIDDPLLLHEADISGMLLMTDFPNFGEGGNTPLGRRRFEKMMRAAISRDINHPSIIAWCLFNETWGFGGQSEFVSAINPSLPPLSKEVREPGTKMVNTESWKWIDEMWKIAKSLDPSRLIEDMSVVAWDHLQNYGHGDTDINSWHFYTNNYEFARKHIENVVKETYQGSDYNYVPGFHQGSQPLINSEYGGVGALDGDIDVSWSFKFLTNELRRHQPLSAYIFTELHDVEWERNGFLNYDRTPKAFGYNPTLVNQGDVLPIDAPPVSRHAAGSEVNVDVYSSHFSRKDYGPVTLHWRLSGIDSLGWVEDELLTGSTSIAFTPHRVELAHVVPLRMPGRTMSCTLWVAAVTDRGVVVARNYIQFYVDGQSPARDFSNGRCIVRLNPEDWSEASWSGGQSTREEAARDGLCFGRGRGWFEWSIPKDGFPQQPGSINVLCEASARREGQSQTDAFSTPSSFQLLLNGLAIQKQILPNHPHDARGALSYLRGGRGAYGYLIHARIEGDLLQQICQHEGDHWHLRCVIPEDAEYPGGLTIYAGDCGRFPIMPTLVIE